MAPTHSGGHLSPEQASFDVQSYALRLLIDPEQKAISGTLTVKATILRETLWLVLDLDPPLRVSAVESVAQEPPSVLAFERRGAQVWIRFAEVRKPGENVSVRIAYHGKPRTAPRPPWIGGFVWSTDASGSPWIAVACQLDGADLWWPCKDHPSDEPEGMDLHITVPSPLIVASNGLLQSVSQENGLSTFHWSISNPINAYNVTVNIARYQTIQGSYRSVAGESIPITFWILPESREQGLELFSQIPSHLRFLEERLGPYPCRNEKYGVAQTPFLGMEHQTIIGYGNNFRKNAFGFDWLHFHELAHEWWGNLVTVSDWRDYWIHEGFASYMEALYAESLHGEKALHDYMKPLLGRLRNRDPVAPLEKRTTVEKYFVAPDFVRTDGDVNSKGAWILHTLRYLIGEEAFSRSLRLFLYPDPELEKVTNGSQFRFVSTDEFFDLLEKIADTELDWFVDLYLRQPLLPRLATEKNEETLHLKWVTPQDLPFPMPVQVKIGEGLQRVHFSNNRAAVKIGPSEAFQVDPANWILREP